MNCSHREIYCLGIFQIQSDINIKIETINSFFYRYKILILNRFSFSKIIFGKKEKNGKIFRALSNYAHGLNNCAQSKNKK